MNLKVANQSDMMFTILTKAGIAAIANAMISGEKIDFAEFALGDGNGEYPNLSEDMTELKNEVYRTKVRHVELITTEDNQNTNQIKITALIPNDAGGFVVRETGLFDSKGNLLAVGRYPITWKPSITVNNAASEMLVRMIIQVANTSVINMKIDPTIINASLKDLEELREEFNKRLDELSIDVDELGSNKLLTNSKKIVAAINENKNNIDKKADKSDIYSLEKQLDEKFNKSQIVIVTLGTINSIGWKKVGDFWVYDIQNNNIDANSIVDINIKKEHLEIAKDILPSNESFSKYVRVFSTEQPKGNISFSMKIIKG